MQDWEHNVLGIINYKNKSKLDKYFEFVTENHDRISGDLVEAGIFRGRSFLATAMLLRELGSAKKVYGYDSFAGFPDIYHSNDDPAKFDDLLAQGRISARHYDDAMKLRAYRRLTTGMEPDIRSISTSGSFTETALSTLQQKIEYLELEKWTVICDGPFSDTMKPEQSPEAIMSAILDCDLYGSYITALNFIWPRLEVGGYIWLDEYYSLKFPGARIACDEFFYDKQDKPQMHIRQPLDFERWYVRRLS